MEDGKRKIEKKRRNKMVIILPLITLIIIIAIAGIILWKIKENKSYEIEGITEFSYFKLYENEKYGVIDAKGTILVTPQYDMLDIPNPSKPVFIGYEQYDSQKGEYQTEVINEKSEKILTQYTRSSSSYV